MCGPSNEGYEYQEDIQGCSVAAHWGDLRVIFEWIASNDE